MLPQSQAPIARDDRSVAGVIARALEERIVSGLFAPGTRLRQDHVAAEFGASHVPVREAFHRLEAAGLLVSEPRRGVRVAPLAPEDVLEVAGMRAALEALALRQAMARGMTQADLDAARRALRDGEAGEGVEAWEEANRRFHASLVAPCRMPRLVAAIVDLHRAGARHLLATWKGLDWRGRSDEEHRSILAAVEAGDVERAAVLVSTHVLAAGDALAAALAGAAKQFPSI